MFSVCIRINFRFVIYLRGKGMSNKEAITTHGLVKAKGNVGDFKGT